MSKSLSSETCREATHDEKYKTLQMIGLTRSSSQEVAEGYGPSIQKSELVADGKSQKYRLLAIRNIVEPATINLEERDLFNEVFKEAITLKKHNRCNGISISRCDRLSRQFEAAMQIALDCKKYGLTIRFVRENQWLRPDDEPIQFILFILNAFGVHTQTKISMANLHAGQRRAASEGKLPAGIGKGMLGYDLSNKKFTTTSFITVIDEILCRALRGDSINRITRDLQERGVVNSSGKIITRATVANVLRHARRYAGIWDWGGYEIRGLIPPRITEEQAEQILNNLKRNRENSYGFGKRKWLSSRVICGICGRKYKLQVKHGCYCLHADVYRAYPPCPSPKITWHVMDKEVWDTFVQCLLGLDTLELMVKDKRKAWRKQKAKTDQQIKGLREQLNKLQRKRRQYSWQQAEGIITGEELVSAHKQIKSEERILNDQLKRLEEFSHEPSPPDRATFDKMASYWRSGLVSELDYASDEVKAKFAEFFDLYITVYPKESSQGYYFSISANIPLGLDTTVNAYDMVFSPLGRLRGAPPLLKTPPLQMTCINNKYHISPFYKAPI